MDVLQILQQLARAMHKPELTPKQLGRLGEEYAVAWLNSLQWRIVDRNWHSRYGELDVVALSPSKELVFLEVKTRRGIAHGAPQEAVTSRKRTAIRRAASQWLIDYGGSVPHVAARFDVLAIRVSADQAQPLVDHIRRAF